MKKINNQYLLRFSLVIALIFTSCEKQDNVIFDDVNGQTLISFTSSAIGLPVKNSEISSTPITVEVSTVSATPRVISTSIDSLSTATPDQYLLSDIIIPAGEYIGTGSLTGIFETLPELGTVKVMLTLVGLENETSTLGDASYTITLERFCPFEISDFYGNYDVIEDESATYKVTATEGPVAGTLSLFNLYDTKGTTIIELDASDPAQPTVLLRSKEFDAALYVSARYGNVWANALDGTTPSSFNICSGEINIFFRRTVSAGSFPGETNCIMTRE